MGDFWVFGYGSLIWRPGFEHVETRPARLFGYRRALCTWSYVHWGTRERPGLVLGLDRGGSCLGMGFRVAEPLRDEVVAYLRARELVTDAYLEVWLPVRLASGETVRALTFINDRTHPQYAGALDAGDAAAIVAVSEGQSGVNADYLASTLEYLLKLGIRDRWLEDVGRRVAVLRSA